MDAETFRTVMTFGGGLIASLSVVAVALIARNNSSTKAIRSQVENNHFDSEGKPINMREENDERHGENHRMLTLILSRFDGVESILKSHTGTLTDHSRWIHELETSTLTREQIHELLTKGKTNES